MRERWTDGHVDKNTGTERERERGECLSTGLPVCWRNLVAHVSFVSKQNLTSGVTAQVQTAETARRALSVMLAAVLVVSFCVCLFFTMRRCFD